jgi:UDP-N-acetylglucosamine 2-epimerase
MMKVISIVGARPQFIKVGIVSRKIRNMGIKEILIHTGQHYDFNMSSSFFSELGIPKPDYSLGVGSFSHAEQTGKMMIEIEKVLLKEKPDWVIVYGDTNSVLAGALASVKLQYPVAHVEAGVRTFNKSIPEEINRIVTDHVSNILFAPTVIAVENLQREGVIDGVFNVGDVMFDIALETRKTINEKAILKRYGLNEKNYILTTIHRAENTDIKVNLVNIWNALLKMSHEGKKVFFPIHPRTLKALREFGLFNCSLPKNLIVGSPVSYTEMLALENNAKLIISDSGGVQREAYFFRTPCIIPKKDTSWPELVNAGWNVLTGAIEKNIISMANRIWEEKETNKQWVPFFGEGNASDSIAEIIYQQFS